jgi:hypothetical protein
MLSSDAALAQALGRLDAGVERFLSLTQSMRSADEPTEARRR